MKLQLIPVNEMSLIFTFVVGSIPPLNKCRFHMGEVMREEVLWLRDMKLECKLFYEVYLSLLLDSTILSKTTFCFCTHHSYCFQSVHKKRVDSFKSFLSGNGIDKVDVHIPWSTAITTRKLTIFLSDTFRATYMNSMVIRILKPINPNNNSLTEEFLGDLGIFTFDGGNSELSTEIMVTLNLQSLQNLSIIVECEDDSIKQHSVADCNIAMVYLKSIIHVFGRNLISLDLSCEGMLPSQLIVGTQGYCPADLSVEANEMNQLISLDCPILSSLMLNGQLPVSLLKDKGGYVNSYTIKEIAVVDAFLWPGTIYDQEATNITPPIFRLPHLDSFTVHQDFEYDEEFSIEILPVIPRSVSKLKVIGNICGGLMKNVFDALFTSSEPLSHLQTVELHIPDEYFDIEEEIDIDPNEIFQSIFRFIDVSPRLVKLVIPFGFMIDENIRNAMAAKSFVVEACGGTWYSFLRLRSSNRSNWGEYKR